MQLRLVTHPDLKRSYQLFHNLKFSKVKLPKTIEGPIELLFYPLIGKKLGYLKDFQLKIKNTGEEPLLLSRKTLELLACLPKIKKNKRVSTTLVISSIGRVCLGRCLESLANQDLPFQKILLSWDGVSARQALSFEKSFLRRRKDLPIEFFHFSRRLGPGIRRNQLAEKSTTSHLVFFDDDNIALPNFHDELVRSVKTVDCSIVATSKLVFKKFPRQLSEVIVPFGSDLVSASHLHLIGDSTMIVEKRAFWEAKGFEQKIEIAEDSSFLLRASLMGHKILPHPVPLLLYSKLGKRRSQQVSYSLMAKEIGDLYHKYIPSISPSFVRNVQIKLGQLHGFRNSEDSIEWLWKQNGV